MKIVFISFTGGKSPRLSDSLIGPDSYIMANLVWLLIMSQVVIHNSLEIYVNAPFPGGDLIQISLSDKDDIYTAISSWCTDFQMSDYCVNTMDLVSKYVFGNEYTPQLPQRTREDASVTRGDIIVYLGTDFKYLTYLEIGCANDDVFDRVKPIIPFAVGVDPKMGGTMRLTSDAFFALSLQTFDLIFVDGDHQAAQAYRDVENALRVLQPGGTIVLHDCNPRTESRQYVSHGLYNGDVWKLIPIYRARPDMEIVTIDADHGVAVLRRRPNRHPLPAPLLQRLTEHAGTPLEAFTYADLQQHRVEMLRLVTMAEFRSWLAEEREHDGL